MNNLKRKKGYKYLRTYEKNKYGTDYIVGDIHGCFDELELELKKIGFNEDTDRLFSVGDLVDRGKKSKDVIKWLHKFWFHPVMGNHEEIFLLYCSGMINPGVMYDKDIGGEWVFSLNATEREELYEAFLELPIAMEVFTDYGKVGIVHANAPCNDWNNVEFVLNRHKNRKFIKESLWSRKRIEDDSIVRNIDAVVVGHIANKYSHRMGNVHLIDTGAVFTDGKFTILDMNTMKEVEMAVVL